MDPLSCTTVTWRGLTFSSQQGAPYAIRSLEGWDSLPSSRINSVARLLAHGRFEGSVSSDERIITLSGHILSQSRDALVAVLGGALGYSAPDAAPEALVVTRAGRTLWTTARLTAFDSPPDGDWAFGKVPFVIEWRASDPFRYAEPSAGSTEFARDLSGLRFPLFTDGDSSGATVLTNLLVNPSGVSTGTAWLGTASITSVTEGPALGPFATSARLTRLAAGAGMAACNATIQPSTAYTLRLRVRSSHALTGVQTWLRPIGSSTGQVSMGTVSLPVGESDVVLTATSSSTAPSASSRFALVLPTGQGPNGATVDIVGVLVEGSVDPVGVWSGSAGNLADHGYAWTGSADASSSTATPAAVATGVLTFGDPGDETGEVTLENEGTAEAWSSFLVHGPVRDGGFEILEVETGRRLRYVAGVPVGLTLVINTAEGVVLLDGQDRLSSLRVREWSSVPPGESRTYRFVSLGGDSAAVLDVELASTYW